MNIVRAMAFTGEPGQPNFAVHIQTNFGSICHGMSTGIVGKENGQFPKALWAAAEELSKQVSGLELVGPSSDSLLSTASQEASLCLAKINQTTLAEDLKIAAAPETVPWPRRFWKRISSRWTRQKRADDAALRSLVKVFSEALHDLRRAVAAHGSEGSDVNRIERCYAQLLGGTKRFCCYPEPPLPEFAGSTANIYPDAAFLDSHPKDATKGHLLEREALAHGLSVLRFPNGSFIASDRSGNRLNFKWSRSPISSGVALGLCNHKEATRARLARCGLPVPRGRVFGTKNLDLALTFAARIGYPVVMKPAAGVRGIGVITNIRNAEELREAHDLYARNPLGLDDLIIEQHVSGEDYRIVVVGDEVVSAVRREPASIAGDGVHSVADLILFKNRIRTLNPHLRKRLIQYDDAAKQLLLRADLGLLSVPPEGESLQLAHSNNISRGGDSIEVVDQLHLSIRSAAIRAVKAIPALEFCGLDFLLEDHTKPLNEQNAAIIELNAHGAIGTGQYPIWGTPRNVARKFLRHCAKRKGIELRLPPAEHLALELKIRGKVTGVGYRRWLMRKAEEYGVSATATNVDSMTVKATIEGQLAPVAALANASVRGPHSSAPFWVAIEHLQESYRSGGKAA